MVSQAAANLGRMPVQLLADVGRVSETDVAHGVDAGMDGPIAAGRSADTLEPSRHRLGPTGSPVERVVDVGDARELAQFGTHRVDVDLRRSHLQQAPAGPGRRASRHAAG
jgi:hypothetical protein